MTNSEPESLVGERLNKPNVAIECIGYEAGKRGKQWKLVVNNLTIAYGSKGKMSALMRVLSDVKVTVPDHYTILQRQVENPIGTTKSVVEMDYNDLDNLVQETYGHKSYECVAAEEWNNYQSHTFDYKTKKPLGEYDTKMLDEFKSGKFLHGITHILFQDMVNNDVLQPGEYLVKVFW